MKDESKVAIVLLSGIGWTIVCLGMLWASITLVSGHIFGDIVFSLVVGVIFGIWIARKLIHRLSSYAEPQSYSTYEIDTGEYAAPEDDYEYVRPSRATKRVARKNDRLVRRRRSLPKEILPEDLDRLLWDDRHHFSYVKVIFKQIFSPKENKLRRAMVSFGVLVVISGLAAGILTSSLGFGVFIAAVVVLVVVTVVLRSLQSVRFVVTEEKVGSFADAKLLPSASSYIRTNTLWEANESHPTLFDKILRRYVVEIRTREQAELISHWDYARKGKQLSVRLNSLSVPNSQQDI